MRDAFVEFDPKLLPAPSVRVLTTLSVFLGGVLVGAFANGALFA